MSVVSLKAAEQVRMLCAAEEAILDAACAAPGPERRAVRDLVLRQPLYRRWKADFRLAVAPAAAARALPEKLSVLRRAGTACEHQRALVDHLRRSAVTGQQREQLFLKLFPAVDFETAAIREHRHYQLAVCTRLALDRLFAVYRDRQAPEQLDRYRALYARYFGLYCDWLAMPNGPYAEIVRAGMNAARRESDAARAWLVEPPMLPPARKFRSRRKVGRRRDDGLPGPVAARR